MQTISVKASPGSMTLAQRVVASAQTNAALHENEARTVQNTDDKLAILNDPKRRLMSDAGFPGEAKSLVPASVFFGTHADGSLTGGADQVRLRLQAERPTDSVRLPGDEFLFSGDADPVVRQMAAGFLKPLGLPGSYEGALIGNGRYSNFISMGSLEVASEHSYNDKAFIEVRFWRRGCIAGTKMPRFLTLGLDILCHGLKNDQPIVRKGEPCVDSDCVPGLAPENVFSRYGYRIPQALGIDAVTQGLAWMIENGVVRVD